MRKFVLLFLVTAFAGCYSASEVAKKTPQGNDVHELVTNRDFKIVSEWALPINGNDIAHLGLLPRGNSGSGISLASNDNHFTLKFDKVDAFLPYFGEQQLGSADYNLQSNAIKLEGYEIKDYSAEYDEKRKEHTIKFKVVDGQEHFNISLKMYNSLRARIIVNSSHRTAITYRGVVTESSVE